LYVTLLLPLAQGPSLCKYNGNNFTVYSTGFRIRKGGDLKQVYTYFIVVIPLAGN